MLAENHDKCTLVSVGDGMAHDEQIKGAGFALGHGLFESHGRNNTIAFAFQQHASCLQQHRVVRDGQNAFAHECGNVARKSLKWTCAKRLEIFRCKLLAYKLHRCSTVAIEKAPCCFW